MAHNILITGGSGCLGGTLLDCLPTANLPSYNHLYALVRTPSQAQAVKQYGAEALNFNPYDEDSVRDAVVSSEISVVFYLIDSRSSKGQVFFLKGLAELKEKTGREVHFLHVSLRSQ